MFRLRRSAVTSAAVLAVTVGLLAGCGDREPRRPNIVVVVLDTVRRDAASLTSREPRPTPHLDVLGSEGTVFSNAWANGPWTVPSHASMLTGKLPSSHECTGKTAVMSEEQRTFADYAGERGYDTAAFYSNPWLTDRMTGMLRGFGEQHSEAGGDTRIMHLGDQGGLATSRNITRWLDERTSDRPFLMFVNYLEAHLPYAPPGEYRHARMRDVPPDDVISTEWAHEFNAGIHPAEDVDWETVRRLYCGDVAAADMLMGMMLKDLKRHGLYENTVIIVTSDHGENIGDHGYMDHQYGVFETLLAVPLVIRAPAWIEPGLRDDPVMLTDIFATVLDLAGVEDAPDLPHARSLLAEPAPADRPLIAEYAGAGPTLLNMLLEINPELDTTQMAMARATVRVGNLRLTLGSDGSAGLEDLAVDPADRIDLERDGRAISEEMIKLFPKVEQVEGEAEVDEEMRESLRSLGYVQ
jgi:arylsulfatase A-like enzyme